ncbi:MAG: hypothetical protein CSA95_09140 [Bacteroidetes bacterium]|nr:MAG: hypothetical protein CSA95_09140 [Bacteroidota bacterium]PIE87804.1 MAG: hypothetical protein CSA04_05130 [Bacteroidota bacterium]
MHRLSLLLTLCLMLLGGRVLSQRGVEGAHELFREGVTAYTEQNYPLAMRKFEKVLQEGKESGELYYNMGNCAYKQGLYPLSIYYYEKAKLFLSSDPDLEANLALANTHIIDEIEEIPLLFYEKWWRAIVVATTPDRWGVITLVLFAFLLALVLFFRFSSASMTRKITFYLTLVFLLLFAVSLWVSVQSHRQLTAHTTAIIFQPSVTAKSSPFEDSIDIFVVHEGTKVTIDNTQDEWVRVRLANGSVGWVDRASLKVL